MKYTQDTGTVKSVDDDKAIILLDGKAAADCAGCCACSAFASGRREIEVDRGGLREGQRVRVSIPRVNPYLSIFFVFILPLALLMGGIFIGQHLQEDPRLGVHAAAGGIAGLAVAVFTAWLVNHLLRPQERPGVEIDESDAN